MGAAVWCVCVALLGSLVVSKCFRCVRGDFVEFLFDLGLKME